MFKRTGNFPVRPNRTVRLLKVRFGRTEPNRTFTNRKLYCKKNRRLFSVILLPNSLKASCDEIYKCGINLEKNIFEKIRYFHHFSVIKISSVEAEHLGESRTEPNRTVRPNFKKKFGRTERSFEHYTKLRSALQENRDQYNPKPALRVNDT